MELGQTNQSSESSAGSVFGHASDMPIAARRRKGLDSGEVRALSGGDYKDSFPFDVYIPHGYK
jgi:hypothetical protein